MKTKPDLKVMSVDDFGMMRRILKNFLNQMGYPNVVEAEDGNSAWEMLQKEDVSLIISDWDMPNMTGLELLEKVRSSEKLKDIPFLLISAQNNESFIGQAKNAGVDHFMAKPFSAEKLRRKIDSIFQSDVSASSPVTFEDLSKLRSR